MCRYNFAFFLSRLVAVFICGIGFFLLFSPSPLRAQNLDSVLCVLDSCIDRRADYEAVFVRRVDSLRHSISLNTDKAKAYRLWTEVGREEFRHSSRKALEAYRQAWLLAEQMGNEELVVRSKLSIALIYGQVDLPWEGEMLLASIGDVTRYTEATRRMFYDVHNDVYDFYRQGTIPNEVSETHLQKASLLTDSIKKYLHTPFQQAINFQYGSLNVQDMVSALKKEYDRQPEGGSKALIAIVLANKYHLLRDNAMRDYYWALSAIYSLRYVCYEYEALLRLAGRMYDRGDRERGVRYAIAAYEMADIWGSGARKVELSATLTRGLGLERQTTDTLFSQMEGWRILAVALLGVIGIGTVMLIRRYRRTRKRNSMQESERLAAQGRIVALQSEVDEKTDTITSFLNLSLDALFRIEQLRNTVVSRIVAGETERLQRQFTNGDMLAVFREESLRRFDISFLRLYPEFIKRVNLLFRPNAQIALSDTEILNNELRVLAFTKMGITDATRIATILGVTVSTVYYYRNRIKSRAISGSTFKQDFGCI